MEEKILDKINSPEELKALPKEEIEPLIGEIREFLIDKVGKSGGHLASNLGVVELTVAMHRVFSSPTDHIIFDVGHQAYVHKMLTGRKDMFDDLRRPGGISGFTLRRESEHDAFGAGHSSTSISAALGYAESDRISGSDAYTVAVVGDGAYTGGMIHEAINNCKPELKLVIILNENGMSISTNKGNFASYLSRVRASKGYVDMKQKTGSALSHIPLIGKPIKVVLSLIKGLLKKIFFKPSYFEDLGFYYIGPIDGNDYKKVERALQRAKKLGKCVFVHLKTTKGAGYPEAELSPEVFHSLNSGAECVTNFHSEAAEELISLADEDKNVLAITAAMGVGTGLSTFEEKFASRYFDVGIAEEHALTFSAGLAAAGMKPYVAIYSTFLQRGYDNIIHDIALQELPVKLLVDRAGISSGDGATHHGIFDVSFLSHVPGFEIISPATYASLRAAIRYANEAKSPIAIRYPNAKESTAVNEAFYKNGDYDSFGIKCNFTLSSPPENIIVTYGAFAERALAAANLLAERGIKVGVVLAERIKPYKPLAEFLLSLPRPLHILYAEEGIKNGGAAMITYSTMSDIDTLDGIKYDIAAIDDNFLSPREKCDIYDYAGLSVSRLMEYFEVE